MTLLDLYTHALTELERPTDSETLALWRDKLTAFANEALIDLSTAFRPWRRDVLPLADKKLHLSALPFACSKVLGVEDNGTRLPFYYDLDVETLCVPTARCDALTVVYRYTPRALELETDVPQLPAACHPLIVAYMVGRVRAQGDAAAQSSSALRLSLYELQKRRLKLDFDEPAAADSTTPTKKEAFPWRTNHASFNRSAVCAWTKTTTLPLLTAVPTHAT